MSLTVPITAEPPLPKPGGGRPGPILFVVALLLISGLISAVVGLAVLVNRSDLEDVTGRGSGALLVTAIGEFVAAALLVAVAVALLRGSKGARLAVTIVVGFRMALAAYWMVAYDGGGLQWHAFVAVALGAFVLWALYGDERSESYFDQGAAGGR